MGDKAQVEVVNTQKLDKTVQEMRARNEDVHARGSEILRETGRLHPDVDIFNKKRVSHNAMLRDSGKYVLVNGIALPILSLVDGTGSTARWVGDLLWAAEKQYTLLGGVRKQYNTQFASGVVQDVYNVRVNRLPVVQVSQFESDERSAEQVRLLQPASMGNDSFDEDYDLGLAEGLYMDLDILNYGLKGYFTLAADDVGRGFVTARGVQQYLGQTLERERIETAEICRHLENMWHLFLLQIPSSGMLPYATDWWQEVIGPSRVIQVPTPELLAEVRAGITYVCETLRPTEKGLIEFLKAGSEKQLVSDADARQIWRWLQAAEEHFGAQTKLPGYEDIPKPSDVFANLRDTWPIGHKRAGENGKSIGSTSVEPDSTPVSSGKPLDWGKF